MLVEWPPVVEAIILQGRGRRACSPGSPRSRPARTAALHRSRTRPRQACAMARGLGDQQFERGARNDQRSLSSIEPESSTIAAMSLAGVQPDGGADRAGSCVLGAADRICHRPLALGVGVSLVHAERGFSP